MAVKTYEERLASMKANRANKTAPKGLYHATSTSLTAKPLRTPWRTPTSTPT